VAPEDVARFKTPESAQRALVASGQDLPVLSNGPLERELLQAAASADNKLLKSLLNQGARVNAMDAFGNTALLLAAREGATETVRLLLKAGARVDGRDGAMTPLAAAAFGGHTSTARLLIKNGADLDAAAHDGLSPLMLAVKFDHLELARLLLDAGARTWVKDRSGDSLLLVTLNQNQPDMLALLLARGVNPNQPDADGLTPLYWAEFLKLPALALALREAGAEDQLRSVRTVQITPYETGGY
jgi:ankyrin repeat protein